MMDIKRKIVIFGAIAIVCTFGAIILAVLGGAAAVAKALGWW